MGTIGRPIEKGTPEFFRYLRLIALAEAPAAVLRAVQGYLNAWPKERVHSLQAVDGGWAPFDWNQRPRQVNGVRDLRRIGDAVHRHSTFLREAGMTPTLELVELDEFLLVAVEKAENFGRAALQAKKRASFMQAVSAHQ